MKVLILEDEALARNRLLRMLDELVPDLEILGMFRSVRETASYLLSREVYPDIIFIDIQVTDGNSFELFDLVDVKSKVVFITAYNEFAVEAFRKNAIDYLLKPLKKIQLQEAILKANIPSGKSLNQLFETEERYKERFLVRFGNKLHTIKTSTIAYIYSRDRISYFYLKDGSKIPSDFKLKELEPMLNPEQYFRANRQCILHIDSIDEMIRHEASRIKLKLSPQIEEEIVISTERTKLFKDWLEA